jgi:hypothetical protein
VLTVMRAFKGMTYGSEAFAREKSGDRAMTLQIDLTPQTEAWLTAEARQYGLLPEDVVRRVIEERACAFTPANHSAPSIDAENAAAIAFLDRKLKEDATDDPEDIRKAEEELQELKRNLNANRVATGERLVFL